MTPKQVSAYIGAIMIAGIACLVIGVACIVVTFLVPGVHASVLWVGIIGVMIGILLFASEILSI